MVGMGKARDQLTVREREILERLARGLSDQQIGAELFLSPNTVRWYNHQIYNKLDVSSRTHAIVRAQQLGLFTQETRSTQRPAPHGQLPSQTNPFIGRKREIAEIKLLLGAYRLLTLTGVGGSGKTRLALRVAEEVSAEYPDGVYFMDLAPLANVAGVLPAVAKALGVIEHAAEPLFDTLIRVLAPRGLLLLIDNFEHVIQAAPVVTDLLAAAPRLTVLATSRESLRLPAEQVYLVPPLSLPVRDSVSVESLTASEAGALFVQRASMIAPRFTVTREAAQVIAEICTRLDGLPLAIELAAARTNMLNPQVLLERLEGIGGSTPLGMLAGQRRGGPARHQTLRGTLDWSYGLLTEEEKSLFARLAVFQGGRSLEAVEAVCGEGFTTETLDVLASLVEKNLVQVKETTGGEPRFTLLEMIHEYARERLEASGGVARVRQRHAIYFVELAERAEPELRRAGYDYWCQRFELELDNFRRVLEWSLSDGDVSLGVRLASAVGLFWYGKGYHAEGIRWTQRLLERLDETPVTYHPPFLISAGRMAWMVDLDAATRMFVRALEVSRRLGDRLYEAWALSFQGYAMMRDPEAAMPIAEASLALFREMEHQPGIAQSLNIIGELARIGGNDQRARRSYEECLAVCQQTGEALRTCYNYVNLAYLAQHDGDHERALRLVRQALQLSRDRNDARDIASFLVTAAGSIAALGQLQRAVRLIGASEAALERMGAFHQPSDQPEIDRIMAAVRDQLDTATYEGARAEGKAMSLEQAVAYAMEEP